MHMQHVVINAVYTFPSAVVHVVLGHTRAYQHMHDPIHTPPHPPPHTGKFARNNCPSYLTKQGFATLKEGAIDKLTIATGTFMGELKARKYTKVCGFVNWVYGFVNWYTTVVNVCVYLHTHNNPTQQQPHTTTHSSR